MPLARPRFEVRPDVTVIAAFIQQTVRLTKPALALYAQDQHGALQAARFHHLPNCPGPAKWQLLRRPLRRGL